MQSEQIDSIVELHFHLIATRMIASNTAPGIVIVNTSVLGAGTIADYQGDMETNIQVNTQVLDIELRLSDRIF